jgi:hypothetical protein
MPVKVEENPFISPEFFIAQFKFACAHSACSVCVETERLVCQVCPRQSKYSRFQYVESTPAWSQACDIGNAPSDITELEAAIHSHQSLYEAMCQAYTEVMNFDFYFFFNYNSDNYLPRGSSMPILVFCP